MRRENQVSVTLAPELLTAIERAAQAEHRSLAAQLRHYAAMAIEEQCARRDPPHQADLETRT